MPRPSRGYNTELLRARVRSEYHEAVTDALAEKNLFDPNKPAHGDMSKLVEQLLVAWLKKELPSEAFKALPRRRIPKI